MGLLFRTRMSSAGPFPTGWLPTSLFAALAIAIAAPAHADDVVLYRCTGSDGALTISDEPCLSGQRQEVMSMLRPRDAPAAPRTTAPPVLVVPTPPPPTVLVQHAPRPLYECVRPDGSVYESDSGDGEPRWVPLWTLGYPVGSFGGYGGRTGTTPRPQGGGTRASSGLSAPPSSSISIPSARERPVQPPPSRRPPPGHGGGHGHGGYDAGTWVQDDCHALPQGEVCARLGDRRDALRTRFFNAQQSERDTLRVEERGLNARLAQDCGVR